MKQRVIFLYLWIALVLYTILYVSLAAPTGTLLNDLLAQTADPFSTAFFNIMGFIPLLFLLDYFLQYKLTIKAIPFIFGFFMGAYSILLGFFFLNPQTSNRKKKQWWIVIVFPLSLLLMYPLLVSSSTDYFSRFFSDALVGIMTVDALMFYGLMIIRSYQLQPKLGWLGLIPVIGYSVVLVLRYLNIQPINQ
jgi:predicted membrane channel-forming protein YqfA (hemolysin III family)